MQLEAVLFEYAAQETVGATALHARKLLQHHPVCDPPQAGLLLYIYQVWRVAYTCACTSKTLDGFWFAS